jgi:hypothetical protein
MSDLEFGLGFGKARLIWTMLGLNDLSIVRIARSMLGEVAARQ